jgi:hypothetical protein
LGLAKRWDGVLVGAGNAALRKNRAPGRRHLLFTGAQTNKKRGFPQRARLTGITSTPLATTVVHIEDDGSRYARDAPYAVNYAGATWMTNVSGLEVHSSSARGNRAFNTGKMDNGPITIDSFSIGQFEVTYELWYAVYMWAINKPTEDSTNAIPLQSYKFSDYEQSASGKYGLEKRSFGLGIEGNGLSETAIAGTIPSQANKYMPVHGINWIDAVVWCNAYNELLSEIRNDGVQTPSQNNIYPYVYSDNSNPVYVQRAIRPFETRQTRHVTGAYQK